MAIEIAAISTIIGIIKDLVSAISALWKWLRTRKSKGEPSPELGPTSEGDSVFGVARRFVQIYKAHGVERSQIPRLLGEESGLSLDAVSTDEKLLTALNENLINKTCEIFGVRREWLDGKDVPIYPYRWFDKNLDAFIDFLARLKQEGKELQCLFVKCPQDKLDKGDERWPIAVVIRQEVDHWGHFSEDSIWRYYPLSDQYYLWGYERTRLQLKAMALIAWQFGIHIGGCQLPKKDIEATVAGTVFPGPLLEPLHHVAWHPDDYIFVEGESCAVADHEEALKVRKFLQDYGCTEKLVNMARPLKTPWSSKSLPS